MAAATAADKAAYEVKILVIGESSVGKSALLHRYADDIFNTRYTATVSVDFKCKKVDIDGEQHNLRIWDTAGQERFRNITKAYYRGAMGIIVMYDITDTKSFEKLHTWMDHISRNATNNVTKILIGNKCDLAAQRAVTEEQGRDAAARFGIDFMETSAKEDINVDDAFMLMARTVRDRSKNQPQLPKEDLIRLDKVDNQSDGGGGCC